MSEQNLRAAGDLMAEIAIRTQVKLTQAQKCLQYIEMSIRKDLEEAGEAASAAPQWYRVVLGNLETMGLTLRKD